ncbi:S8 family serine peptidase [Profundibacter sp.]
MHDHVVTQADSEPEDAGDYSTWGVLSTDVPGAFGAEDGGVSTIEETGYDSSIMQRSQFASFGGTSAASGIVAGVVSLLQAKRRKEGQAPMTGVEMKLHLQTNCPDLVVGPDGATVKRIDADSCLQAISTP